MKGIVVMCALGVASCDKAVPPESPSDARPQVEAGRIADAAIDGNAPRDAGVTPCNTAGGEPSGVKLTTLRENLAAPILLASPPSDPRLFVGLQDGQVIALGENSDEIFLDIASRVVSGGERGLLGLAFHPDYATNGRFFVHYSRAPGGDTQLSEFRRHPSDPDHADAQSEISLLTEPQPYANHNGGSIAFGRDGFLYLGLGDGGSAGDPQGRGQDLTTLLGKIVRIDVDRKDSGSPYAIPVGNPNLGASAKREILHYGLRNPWRFSFDHSNGDLYIGDVGQNNQEEVDVAPFGSAGLNFGWDIMEGNECHEPRQGCDKTGLTLPVAVYGHDKGDCTVIGGYVYRGCNLPGHHGRYFFSDYCSGKLYSVVHMNGVTSAVLELSLQGTLGVPVSFGEDSSGELYVVDYNGRILRLDPK